MLVAVAAAVVRWPAGVVESHYSRGVYPAIQTAVTGLTNLTRVSSLDVLTAAAAVGLLAALWRVHRSPSGSRWRVGRRLAVLVCATAAAAYLAFLALWGLNYQRPPLSALLDFDAGRVTPDAVRALAFAAVDEANALRDRVGPPPGVSGSDQAPNLTTAAGATTAPRAGATVPDYETLARTLAAPFAQAAAMLGLPPLARPGRPKIPVLTWYFRAAGVAGMTNPFGLETLLADNLLPHERPMAIAHEWGHLAGLGPESEAGVVAFLACVRGDAQVQYSAWVDVALRAIRGLDDAGRTAALARLSPGVLADIRAMAERSRRDEVRRLRLAAWDAYDRYLRAHRVPGGIRSYDQVVVLLVGTRFDPGWVPARR